MKRLSLHLVYNTDCRTQKDFEKRFQRQEVPAKQATGHQFVFSVHTQK